MAASAKMVFSEGGKTPEDVVRRALAAPVSLELDDVCVVRPGRAAVGEVWSPQLLPYREWTGAAASGAAEVAGSADGDLLSAGSLGMGVDDARRANLLALAATQHDVGGAAAVAVPQHDADLCAVSVQQEDEGYALVGFDLRKLAEAAGVATGLVVVLPSFVDGKPVVRIAPGAFARRLVRGIGVDVLVVPDTVRRIGAGAFSALPGRHIHLGAAVSMGGEQACDLLGVTPPLERRTYSVGAGNASYRADGGSLLSADGEHLLFFAPPYAADCALPEGVKFVGEYAFCQGCATPHVVRASQGLTQVKARQWDDALWICPDEAPAAARLRKRGVRVCGLAAAHRDACWFDLEGPDAVLVAGPPAPTSASKRFARAAAEARATSASDGTAVVDADEAAARAEANDCGGLVSGGRLGPVGQGPSAAALARPAANRLLELPAEVAGKPLASVAARALPYAPQTVVIPASVRAIGDGNQCRGTRRLVLPEGLERVGAHCFCSRTLETVALPRTLRSVGAGSFEFAVCRLAHTGVCVHVPADQLLSCFREDAPEGCDPFDLAKYDEVLRAGKNVPDRLGALLHRLAAPVDISDSDRAAFADEVRSFGREALVRVAREGDVSMVRALADAGLFDGARFDVQIELLRQANRMDCVAYLMEWHRKQAGASCSGEGGSAGRGIRDRFAL